MLCPRSQHLSSVACHCLPVNIGLLIGIEPMIERTFRDIPKGKLYEADQRSFLVSLGWSRGSTWTDLLSSNRVLIVSEAGAGKTHECRERAQCLWDAGEPAFFVELSGLALGDLLLSTEEQARLDAWRASQSDVATFFLDSIDELHLSLGSFEQALKRLNRKIGTHLRRARIIITTRPIPFDEELVRLLLPIPPAPATEPNEEIFADIAMGIHEPPQIDVEDDTAPPEWRTVALMPLSDEQIAEFAMAQGVEDSMVLLGELKRRNAQEFARRPQDLIELCADWREHRCIRTHRDQVRANVRVKLQPRDGRREVAELSTDKATEGASRLALALSVTRRMTIRHSAASDDVQDHAALDPAKILPDWRQDERRALLERPLFGFASYGRVRFHHRSVAEYLAAERLLALRQRNMPVRALIRLLFAQSHDKTIVLPSKRPIAGWLALSEDRIFEMLRDHDPSVLVNEGDPESLGVARRIQLLRAYVKRYGQGGWRGLSVPHIQIHRFASPELANALGQLWRKGIENPDVRLTLLGLIAEGPIPDCADIAHEVTCNAEASDVERTVALDAMVASRDPRLAKIAADVAAAEPTWPATLARLVVPRLFPQDFTVDQLCQTLSWTQEPTHSAGDLSWELPRLIETAELDARTLEELRDGLVQLISAGLRWREEWPHVVSDRLHLCNTLAATCIRGLKGSTSNEWLCASVLSLHQSRRKYSVDDAQRALRERLANLSADENERCFWAADTLMQSLRAIEDPWDRLAQITLHDGPVNLYADRDLNWVKNSLGDTERSEGDRGMLLLAAMRLGPAQEQWSQHVSSLRPLVADCPNLLEVVDKRLRPAKRDKELERREQTLVERQRQQERLREENKGSWIRFWREVAEHPETAFSPDRTGNTAWNLWRAMSSVGKHGRASGWNRRFIEEHFGNATADRLRCALMQVWRDAHPTLSSERPEESRNTYLEHWQLGLAGIHAESEDPSWAVRLSKEEATLAARYVPLEFDGMPAWIENLVDLHPDAVDSILGNELSWELKREPGVHSQSRLLQHIGPAPRSVARLFLPRLRAWLNSDGIVDSLRENLVWFTERLRQVIAVMQAHGDEETRAHLLDVARDRLQRDPPKQLAFVWLRAVMETDPDLGVKTLEFRIRNVEPDVRSEAVEWFSTLFGDRHDQINLKQSAYTPNLLLELLRLAYRHVRVVDDVKHDGTYTPDTRDHAEFARNCILTTLLETKGEAGWASKLEFANDPLCSHAKDRIIAITEEHWAKEIDSVEFDEIQAVALDKTGEAPASTNEALFAILVDRLADLDELLLRDTSPREAWAGIRNERVMRREIARELENSANGLYRVDQEAVTADEKETDIRLRSVLSDHQAVIELKRADQRSAHDLRNAIYEQLVKRYMWAENTKSGCLLLTLSENRKWKHPDTRKLIGVLELISLLETEAQRVEATTGGEISLVVHLLDLRPRF